MKYTNHLGYGKPGAGLPLYANEAMEASRSFSQFCQPLPLKKLRMIHPGESRNPAMNGCPGFLHMRE